MATIGSQMTTLVNKKLPYGAIVRAHSQDGNGNNRITALVLKDGSIRMLRDGFKTPSTLKKGQTLGSYPNFSTLVQVLNPDWLIEIKGELTPEQEAKNATGCDKCKILQLATPGKTFNLVDKKHNPGKRFSIYITLSHTVFVMYYDVAHCKDFEIQYEYSSIIRFAMHYGLTSADFETQKPTVESCPLHGPLLKGGLSHTSNSNGNYSIYAPSCNGCEWKLC